MAQSSFKMKIIGSTARALKAIPVIRPQDLASKGDGTIIYKGDPLYLHGKNTSFKQQVGPRDIIVLSKTLKAEVVEVISDSELKLKAPLGEDAIHHLNTDEDIAYKVIPHVDQSVLYEKVHERLDQNECIVIFPEGGSHDRTEMLPLKAGFAIMALSAMAENDNLDVKIVPVGLNYFHPHRFRSRAVVSYGAPITISKELVENYKAGGPSKRDAISKLLAEGYDGLKSVTVNAPKYETMLTIATARRLYKPADQHKLSIDQVVELNRRFLLGFKYFENDPKLKELMHRIQAYNNTLKYFGLRDYQVAKTDIDLGSALPVLIVRIFKLLILSLFGFPALVLNSPLIITALIISRSKQKKALANSSVKIAARDVLATWKILVALVFAPALYGFYSFLVFIYLWTHHYDHSFVLSLAVWVVFPLIQYVSFLVLESSLDIYRSLPPLFLSLSNRNAAAELREMRGNLSQAVTDYVNENGSIAIEDFDINKFNAMPLKEKADSRGLLGSLELSPPNTIIKWFDDKNLFNFTADSSSDSE
ncbi:hypothetical protein K501DRAFT_176694 [Backusella circina FSU 941]|nr:hypothetical protein K501DRAFT_176694 [Backusella circina FSU 941]